MPHHCPECGNALFTTKRMQLNWLDVLIALVLSVILLILLFNLMQAAHVRGRGNGYILLGVIGAIGWLFSRHVRKTRFEVKSCVRCPYQNTTTLLNNHHNE